MKAIEKQLHQLHAQSRPHAPGQLPSRQEEREVLRGFVRVNSVAEGSPAALAVSVAMTTRWKAAVVCAYTQPHQYLHAAVRALSNKEEIIVTFLKTFSSTLVYTTICIRSCKALALLNL